MNFKFQISNFLSTLSSRPKGKFSRGFTLVELLAVIGVIVTVGGIASGIIFSSLRASNKANQIEKIRQNGNFALVEISKTITYAKSFNGASVDGVKYTTDCTSSQSPTPTPTPTNFASIRVILFDESQVTYSCTPAANPTSIVSTVGSQTTDLIDTNNVAISSCYFTCSQTFKTDSPTIGINLALRQKEDTQFAEKTASILFNTSVTMRNPNK